MLKLQTANGKLTSYALACGYVETAGAYVALSRENGCYFVRRSYNHPAGHEVKTARTLTVARRIARMLSR